MQRFLVLGIPSAFRGSRNSRRTFTIFFYDPYNPIFPSVLHFFSSPPPKGFPFAFTTLSTYLSFRSPDVMFFVTFFAFAQLRFTFFFYYGFNASWLKILLWFSFSKKYVM